MRTVYEIMGYCLCLFRCNICYQSVKRSNAGMMLRQFTNNHLLIFSGTAVMSDFIESEAEESEEEFEEKDLKPKKTQRFMQEDGET